MYRVLPLSLFISAVAQGAECTDWVRMADVNAALQTAKASGSDPQSWVTPVAELDQLLRCLRQPLDPKVAPEVHLAFGFRSAALGELERASWSFSAAKSLLPIDALDPGFSGDSPLVTVWRQSPRVDLAKTDDTDGLYDGLRGGRPAHATVGQRVDERGLVTHTRYLYPGDPFGPITPKSGTDAPSAAPTVRLTESAQPIAPNAEAAPDTLAANPPFDETHSTRTDATTSGEEPAPITEPLTTDAPVDLLDDASLNLAPNLGPSPKHFVELDAPEAPPKPFPFGPILLGVGTLTTGTGAVLLGLNHQKAMSAWTTASGAERWADYQAAETRYTQHVQQVPSYQQLTGAGLALMGAGALWTFWPGSKHISVSPNPLRPMISLHLGANR